MWFHFVYKGFRLGVEDLNCKKKLIRLIDFDISRDVGTQPNGVSGTVGYIAPECFHGIIDPKNDVYAVGIIMYALLTSEFPHDVNLYDVNPNLKIGSPELVQIYEKLIACEIDWTDSIWKLDQDMLQARELCIQTTY